MATNPLVPTSKYGSATYTENTHSDGITQIGLQNSVSPRVEAEDDTVRLHHQEGDEYRSYKIRWLGFVQLALMNIVVSWDVSGIPATWLKFASLCE